jgi:hypothetical protein
VLAFFVKFKSVCSCSKSISIKKKYTIYLNEALEYFEDGEGNRTGGGWAY